MSVAFIYLATRVPSMLGNASPFDSWLQTLYFGFSLPRPMARSISSLGLVAGGAAAGSAARSAVASNDLVPPPVSAARPAPQLSSPRPRAAASRPGAGPGAEASSGPRVPQERRRAMC